MFCSVFAQVGHRTEHVDQKLNSLLTVLHFRRGCREDYWKRELLNISDVWVERECAASVICYFVTMVTLERSSDASLWPTCVFGSVVNDIRLFALGCMHLPGSEA